jgi:hypothetical protein
MVCFQTKNPKLGKFLVYFMTIWSILLQLEIFYGHLVRFVVIWYNFPRFGILDQEKSGNPAPDWIDVDVKCRMSRRTINRCRGTMLSVQL